LVPENPPSYYKLYILIVFIKDCAMKAIRILVVVSDDGLAAKTTAALEQTGCEVVRAVDGFDGLKKLYEVHPQLIILDKELPKGKIEDTYWRLRQASYVPLMVLGSEEEAVEMLELGADSYMVKPPNLNELVARVRALLRRRSSGYLEAMYRQEINNNPDNGGNNSNGLTATEFRLASCLLLNEGRLLDYPELISGVWGENKVTVDTLHIYMRRLRSKLVNLSIFRFRGIGYYCLANGRTAL
jgi:DNA-binding response OmpR family regulator